MKLTLPLVEETIKKCVVLGAICDASLFLGIKELFPDSAYCYLDYYDHKNDYHEIALEMRIDAATLLCYFDENDKCNACFVFFDNADDINTYIELCNHLFEYNPTMGNVFKFHDK